MPSLPANDADALITANLDVPRIVARQVLREMGAHLALDDLEAAGREGLVRAAQKFDASRGVPFRRFANHRIRGAMIDALRRESTLPRRARQRLLAMQAALELNEGASEDLAAPRAPGTTSSLLDLRLADHLANLATAMAIGLVAKTAVQEDQAVVAVSGDESVEDVLVREQLRERVRGAVQELPDQERTLVERHYFGGERFDLVAAELGLSKSWASRLHTRAVERLTQQLKRSG